MSEVGPLPSPDSSTVAAALITPLVERALRRAADAHREQLRKGTDHPYFQHPAAVALILARLGFDETVLAATLLHDVVEDTPVTQAEIAIEFGPEVALLVAFCTERKLDAAGQQRPWAERKAEHLAHLATAPREARAIVLADKLHNLTSLAVDLSVGDGDSSVWDRFNASRKESLAHTRRLIEILAANDDTAPIQRLAAACRAALAALETDPGIG